MIEQQTIYRCDDCGDRIDSKIEPSSYPFERMNVTIMLCNECRRKLKGWLK